MKTHLCAALLLLALVVRDVAAQDRVPSTPPRLVVLLMVDQMRADYVERDRHLWTGGLDRLLADGAWFREASYPYVNTVTCAGHASVSTGALPSVHGMIMNTWWDRMRSRVVACADDPTVMDLSYGRSVDAPGESASGLLAPTFADELRAQRPSGTRVVSLSLKARAALTMGGQQPDAVAWVVDQGAWVTSTAFPHGLNPAIAEYISSHPVERELYTTWDRARPQAAYANEPAAIGVRSDAWQHTFPHTIQTWDDWQASPSSDAYLGRLALHAARSLRLGSPGNTDFLAISFSALDLVGHIYGPDSHEVQDVLIRLDSTLGTLLDGLDDLVGRDHYVVALSADHGVAPTPERTLNLGIDAGRIQPRSVTDVAEKAVARVLGPGHWVNRLLNGDLYLEDAVFEQLRGRHGALHALRAALEALPGIRAVFTRDQLTGAAPMADPLQQQVANGFHPERSGDVALVLKPFWLVGGSGGANHGTPYRYDTHVPVVFWGPGIRSGQFSQAVTPLDIAPTLAFLAGITMPHAQGQVLTDALAPSSTTR